MDIFRFALFIVVIFVLVNPTEAWRFRKTIRRVGRGMKKLARKIAKPVRKVACKALFSIACPAAVGAAGAVLAGGSYGLGTTAAIAGTTLGKNACHTRAKRCKRSVPSAEIVVPFSDEFKDYDNNGDKLISYEEFSYAIMRSLPMAAPEELREPFLFADFDDDEYLDIDEFQGAPFLFAHEERTMTIVDASGITDNSPETPFGTDNTPEIALVTDNTPEIALVTDNTPEIALVTDNTPEIALVTDNTPEIALVTDNTPEIALVTDNTPEIALVADNKPLDVINTTHTDMYMAANGTFIPTDGL